MQIEDINLTKLASFGGDMPDHWFTFLREEAPVWFHPPVPDCPDLDGEGFWVFSKYDDIQKANRDHRTFSAESGPGRTGGGIMLKDVDQMLGSVMIMTDPPKQQRMRQLVNVGFSPRGVRRLEEYTRELTVRLVDDVLARDESQCEFVSEIAAEVPLQVIAEILGVPEADRRQVFTWTNKALDDTDGDDRMRALVDMYAYANALGNEKKANPTDDVFSRVVAAEIPGEDGTPERLNDFEIASFFQLIATGGSETTRNSITGGLLAFMDNPDQLELLLRDRTLMPKAIEEILRYTSPVNYFRRTATHDVEVRGQRIEAGQKVSLWYCSGNRDEEVFADPFRFDITRWPNDHFAFGGGGAHYCLGANLAKMEMDVIFSEILNRMTDFERAGEIARFNASWYLNVFGGYEKLPIRFRALG
ncbi:MAG: cytochrome P450 [Candidatus Binatia bacterium]|nr:cytochrome P450 [Candidatus Binatia bacterium]